jgi:hypothetical protein
MTTTSSANSPDVTNSAPRLFSGMAREYRIFT